MSEKQAGRFTVNLSYEGKRDHSYVHGCEIRYRTGWNDHCPIERINLSVEEMRDLRYILDRAIALAEAKP